MSNKTEVLACEIYFNAYFMGYGYIERSPNYEWVHWQNGDTVNLSLYSFRYLPRFSKRAEKVLQNVL